MVYVATTEAARKELAKKFLDFKYFALFDSTGTEITTNGGQIAEGAVSHDPSTGIVTTIAGIGFAGATDGPGSTATFNNPQGIVVDSTGVLFVADSSNHKIRKIVQ